MSTIIKLRCLDQVLTFESTPVVASGGLEEDFIQVEFCSKWDGLTKTAVFWRNEKDVYHVPLDDADSCAIPREVLVDEGAIYFGLFGVSVTGKQRTSEAMRYTIVKGAITSGTKPTDPTPDIYTQLLAKYQAMLDLAEEIAAAEAAFEQAMQVVQTAFEQTMSQQQAQHEQAVDADQAAFEQAMQAAQTAFEQEITRMIEAGLLPDNSVGTSKLKDGAVTATKIAAGVLIDAYTKTQTLTDATKALFGLGASAVPNDVFAKLAASSAQIAVGSYKGTEKYGSSNKNKLTFGFTPKVVIVTAANTGSYYNGHGVFINSCDIRLMFGSNFSGGTTNNRSNEVTWGTDSIQWYIDTSCAAQLNAGNTTYWYFAIG